MVDPWGFTCLSSQKNVLNNKFEDNFVIENLPDSTEYLAVLERKLAKLKNRNNKDKELLKSLSETKQSYLERIVESDSTDLSIAPEFDQPIVPSRLECFIAPQKQANSISELYELVKYDQLGQLFEKLEEEQKKIEDNEK